MEHLFLRNDGNFTFEEIGEDRYEFSWGGVFEDINLDGTLDLLFSQNFFFDLSNSGKEQLTAADGKILLNSQEKPGSQFYPVNVAPNKEFSNTPLIVDVNNDGLQDIFWINMQGNMRLYINNTPNPNNYVQIMLSDSVESRGAKVKLTTTSNKAYHKAYHREYHREFVTSVGLVSDQTPVMIFGLHRSEKPTEIEISWRENTKQKILQPKINQMIHISKP